MALSKEDEIGVDIEHHKDRKNMDGIVSSYFHSAEHEEYQKQKSDADKINEATRTIKEMLELIDKIKLESVSVKRWKISLEKIRIILTS